MSNATYCLEKAKTGRSSCKKCKEKIQKGEIRLGVEKPGPGDLFNIQSWYHPECMPYPRALKKDGIQVEEFVSDLLEDLTTEKILSDPAQVTVMVEKIRMKGRPKVGGEGEGAVSNNDLGADAIIDRVKRTLDLLSREDDDDDDIAKPAAKKAKKEGAPAKISARDRARVEIWAQYEMLKADVLKDMLRWNRQMLGGKKNMLLVRIIDGQMNGRLARCPTCLQGRLKLDESDPTQAICNGYYDEEAQLRYSCYYKTSATSAPRFQPFYTEEPTEEEKEMMIAEAEDAKAGGADAVAAAGEEEMKLTSTTKGMAWDLHSTAGIKQAASDILLLCQDSVALPTANARQEVGRILVSQRPETPAEAVRLIGEQFGFKKVKEEAAKQKTKAAGVSCAHPKNAPVLEAIDELSSLYFKEGNSNAGGSYKKAAAAIRALDFEITEGNAKSLGKAGKNKVNGVGKGTADKMHEFLTTGKMEKLEEKRAAN